MNCIPLDWEFLYIYTRQENIENEELFDVSHLAHSYEIDFPTSVTKDVWNLLSNDKFNLETVFTNLSEELKKLPKGCIPARLPFSVDNKELITICSPGDSPSPTFTIMLEEEEICC